MGKDQAAVVASSDAQLADPVGVGGVGRSWASPSIRPTSSQAFDGRSVGLRLPKSGRAALAPESELVGEPLGRVLVSLTCLADRGVDEFQRGSCSDERVGIVRLLCRAETDSRIHPGEPSGRSA